MICVDEEENRESDQLEDAMRRGAMTAIVKLSLAAAGESVFQDDRELRACIVLARIATCLLKPSPEEKPLRWLAHPDVPPEEALRLLDELEKAEPDQEVL